MPTLISPRLQCVVWLSLLMVAAGGCAPATESSRAVPAQTNAPTTELAAPALQPVKVSYVKALDQAPLFVGIDRGYWHAQGIDIQAEPVQSAADAIAFLANGELDLTVGLVAVPFFNAIQRGLDVRIIAPVAYVPLWTVLVRKDLWDSGTVRALGDLHGRRIYSVAPGSGANYARLKWQEAAGVRSEDVETINMPLPDTLLAMANGQLDAGSSFSEPWSTRMLLDGTAVVLDSGPPIERLSVTLMAGPRLRHEQPELGRRFMLGFLQAVRDLQTDEQLKSDATVDILARWTGQPPELVRELRYLPRFDPNQLLDVDSVLDQQRVHIAAGATTYTEPLPADRLIDTQFTEYAVQQLGRR